MLLFSTGLIRIFVLLHQAMRIGRQLRFDPGGDSVHTMRDLTGLLQFFRVIGMVVQGENTIRQMAITITERPV